MRKSEMDREGQEARDRIRAGRAEQEASERKCRCRWPLPGRRYLGVPLCHLCQRLMEDR